MSIPAGEGLRRPSISVAEARLKDAALFDYRLVAGSFDALRLDAAPSFRAEEEHDGHAKNKPPTNLLIVSPYIERSHLLDLATTVSKSNQLLAKALTNLRSLNVRRLSNDIQVPLQKL